MEAVLEKEVQENLSSYDAETQGCAPELEQKPSLWNIKWSIQGGF
jgi:hypothetical protein